MGNKVIPYGRQDITHEDINAVIETLQSDFLTQGPKIKEFEKKFAESVEAKYAVAVNNATAGLHIAVMALGLKEGDRVITTPITFAASANCVRFVGGEVWFADIDRDTYLLSLERTKELIESKPKGFFKGIIPVDFAGLPIQLEGFKQLADMHGLWILEDACHAPGGYFLDSKKQKQYCGNGIYADAAVFSFHPVKHIACGEGGMVTTNSEDVYKKLLLLRSHGITKENMSENHGGWFYEMQTLGFNYRITDFQAALGISQLARNKNGVAKRNEIAKRYKDAFNGRLKFQVLPDNSLNAHHLFVIEVDNRKELYDYLHQNNIYAQIHYIPVHQLPYYKTIGYNSDTDLSNSEDYYSKCISLPMYPTLTEEEQEFVIETIMAFSSKNN
ncbi:UDP-4-amino-4,6-dideoxy-N-acetyl-beta-L-altrosamine transaminase [Flavobacterium sp. Fl-318]|uniref:UDP-4-amino-4, 6-dideoxy-N-acetyl-beta-L-altrosamine transaminase n=1 Tax=Flavobacterium cupriresistens TaxID=2893885 RepID=A0ABU4RDS6_9FLAO|nr:MULTISPECIES: UDP-4-amino-4,6-dideoxy-N-acetyl-beta-L-altrosamine transaminase [unclassified Flavobacterium]MDX6190128.1 UDP-4-amino-4,6-dideoxy-N-acetyl-beta-L-altrosamine transaminase [Flavobacterium sp. Fl-318]UFH42949.1 UDP-4-amino-4,6-dideoxy-N-acetyl-beta-L-altrosamine transaminase [Flavobacterium sp. F-323]